MADLLTDGVTPRLLGIYMAHTYGYTAGEVADLLRRHLPAVQESLAGQAWRTPYGEIAALVVRREKSGLLKRDGLD